MEQDRTLAGLLFALKSSRPYQTALIDNEQLVSYEQLAAASQRLAGGLSEIGIVKGDRVVLWLPNSVSLVSLMFALAQIGAIAFMANTRFKSFELADILERSGANALAFAPGFKGIDFAEILRDVPEGALKRLERVILCGEGGNLDCGHRHLDSTHFDELLRAEPRVDMDAEPDEGCVIFTTSGTTKAPKFVVHSHGGVVDHARDAGRALGYDAADTVLLQALPLCGVFGYSQLMAGLALGCPAVLMSSFAADSARELIGRHKVTQFNGTDEMFKQLLGGTQIDDLYPLRRCGFAAFSGTDCTALVTEAANRGICLHGLFGMSETQALFAAQSPHDAPEDRALAGGFPVSPFAKVRVRDPNTGEVLPLGNLGELEFHGPSLMKCYFNDPISTSAAFSEDGYFRSGDLGILTNQGRFTFVSRLGDVMRLNGFLVSPQEVEAVIEKHSTIASAQVVGCKNATKAVAFVIIREGAAFDPDALRAYCERSLAGYKVPQIFISVSDFPKTKSANGEKIQRQRLREIGDHALNS